MDQQTYAEKYQTKNVILYSENIIFMHRLNFPNHVFPNEC